MAAVILALGIANSFWLSKPVLIPLFIDTSSVASIVSTHFLSVTLFPLISVWAYPLDGIFIGAGKT